MFKEVIIGAGGILIIATIIATIKRFMEKKDSECVDSIYIDELNVGEIKKWFADKVVKDTLKGLVLYPTEENITKWKLKIDASQQGNMLIQVIYDESKEEIVAYREIVFSSLSPKLKELLDSNGGVFVIEK